MQWVMTWILKLGCLDFNVLVPLTSCVTLDMFHNFSGLSLLLYEMGLVMVSASKGCCEEINLILIKDWSHA